MNSRRLGSRMGSPRPPNHIKIIDVSGSRLGILPGFVPSQASLIHGSNMPAAARSPLGCAGAGFGVAGVNRRLAYPGGSLPSTRYRHPRARLERSPSPQADLLASQ